MERRAGWAVARDAEPQSPSSSPRARSPLMSAAVLLGLRALVPTRSKLNSKHVSRHQHPPSPLPRLPHPPLPHPLAPRHAGRAASQRRCVFKTPARAALPTSFWHASGRRGSHTPCARAGRSHSPHAPTAPIPRSLRRSPAAGRARCQLPKSARSHGAPLTRCAVLADTSRCRTMIWSITRAARPGPRSRSAARPRPRAPARALMRADQVALADMRRL